MYLSKDYKIQNTSNVDTLFEIPEFADFLTYRKESNSYLFWKGETQCINPNSSLDTLSDGNFHLYDYTKKCGAEIIWRRGTLVEYLNPADWSLHVVDVDNDAAGEDWIKLNSDTDYLIKMGNDKLQVTQKGIDGVKSSSLFGGVLWSRYTQPEELRFVDDEPKHQHYFKDFSDCKKVDVYRVLDRFNVVHPCQQHIAKKALCTGNRGHKDLLRDIQDIIDTAERWKDMLLEDSRDGEG